MKRFIRNICLCSHCDLIIRLGNSGCVRRSASRRRVKVRILEEKILELENGKTY
jgi:hypothetical protein